MTITIIRTDGTEEQHEVRQRSRVGPNELTQIARLIHAHGLDVINLRDGRVLLVDDEGYETREESEVRDGVLHVSVTPIRARKPVNAKGTALYHSICKPGTTHQVVGDVAIANDIDFA